MRSAILVFAMMSCAGLAYGAGHVVSSGQVSQQAPVPNAVGDRSENARQTTDNGRGRKVPKSSDRQRAGARTSGRSSKPSNRVSPSQSSHPEPRSIAPRRLESGGVMNVQPVAGQLDRAASGALIHDETASRVAAIRPPTGIHPTAPSLIDVRHRGPNPAIVGGVANSKMRNAGSINGTRINRRP